MGGKYLSNTKKHAMSICYKPESKIVKHFVDIVLGSEYGNGGSEYIKKWKKNKPVTITLDGNYTYDDIGNIQTMVNELVDLTGLNIEISTTDDTGSGITIFFGGTQDYARKYDKNVNKEPNAKAFFTYNIDKGGVIYKATIFIRSTLEGLERKDVIKEELTQVLGFTNDSVTQRDSLFYQYKYTDINLYNGSYSKLDREIIKILYSNDVKHGWSTSRVVNHLQCKRNLKEFYTPAVDGVCKCCIFILIAGLTFVFLTRIS
jgi:hypothetical protein